MIKLDPTAIEELIILLKPHMKAREEREALLYGAFGDLNPLRSQIDCSGATGTFIPKLLQKLTSYGEVKPGKEALCVLLETIQQGVSLQEQKLIDRLLRQFSQLQPLQAQYFQGGGSKYQDLSAVTVGIRNATNSFVGTGTIVNGKILTFGRVITASGSLPEGKVNLYLPKISRGGSRSQQAIVECSFPERKHYPQDDDIVVLSLINGAPINKNAHLQSAQHSIGNQFHIYGFTGLDEQPTDYIRGEIIGPTECPIEVDAQIDCLKLITHDTIYPAMAGSAVLDLSRNFIVGLIARPKYSNGGSMAFDGDIINLEPLHTILNREFA